MTDIQNPQSSVPPAAPTPEIAVPPPSGTALKKAIITVIVLAIIGSAVAVFYFLPKLLAKPQPEPTPQITAPASLTPPAETPTTTAKDTAATTAQEEPAGVTFQSQAAFDQEVQMFEGDIVTLGDSARSYSIKAAEFTDSRCPEGVQCFWAGERGIRLEVTDLLKDKTESMKLATITAKTLDVMGLNGTLIEIEDGKGGPYATIRFE